MEWRRAADGQPISWPGAASDGTWYTAQQWAAWKARNEEQVPAAPAAEQRQALVAPAEIPEPARAPAAPAAEQRQPAVATAGQQNLKAPTFSQSSCTTLGHHCGRAQRCAACWRPLMLSGHSCQSQRTLSSPTTSDMRWAARTRSASPLRASMASAIRTAADTTVSTCWCTTPAARSRGTTQVLRQRRAQSPTRFRMAAAHTVAT